MSLTSHEDIERVGRGYYEAPREYMSRYAVNVPVEFKL